ncbi:MAG: hypothetical protein KAQ94_04155 [Arcobacteraceae bacterium]|nr:hypothetical protein [Arcobacteraceae bacterium]
MKLKFLLTFILVITTLNAQDNKFILLHDGLIDQRAQDKIQQIGDEVQKKLKTDIYVHIIENNGINMDLPRGERIIQMREFDKKVLSKLKQTQNYALLTLSIDQMYANILMSDNLKSIIDKDDILSGYVIPLLASKDKNTLFAKTSAACLNGYAQIADSLAKNKNIKLESSIGSEGKIAGTIWKVFMYTLVLFGIGAYAVIVMKQKKAKA